MGQKLGPTCTVAAAHNLNPQEAGAQEGRSADRKRRRSEEHKAGGQGTPGTSSGGATKKGSAPWTRAGLCRSHYTCGDHATDCNQPFSQSEN